MAWLNAALFAVILLGSAYALAPYITNVFEGRRTWLSPVLLPLERSAYRLCGVEPQQEMTWVEYALAALSVSAVGVAVLYALLRIQGALPLNPQHFPSLSPELAWNTAVSFATTTDWEFYSGESTMSYLSQMSGLAWQSFIAAATGLAAGIAVIRGFARRRATTLGNFWVDFTRGLLYVLLPLSVLFGLLFMWQGIPQNFSPYITATSAEHFVQSITGGPMASQEAIKLLGGNGGGFVGANSASPNENPTGLSNLIELLAMFLIPAALPLVFGRMTGNARAGRAILLAMFLLFGAAFVSAQIAEAAGNPLIHALGVQGGNMEGKEARFGVANAGLSLAVATDSGNGSSNFDYDPLMPLGGLVAMVNMQLAEIIFGGVGSGLYGMLVFAVITVFIAGLLVGRTPEYLGKKIERREIQFAMLAVLIFPALILAATAVAVVVKPGLATLTNSGPHGFSEILYAFTSVAANNGSAFAGLGPNLFYDLVTGVVMLGGRFLVMIPTLALASSLAARPANEKTTGTFSTDDWFFTGLLTAVILVVGALTFLPADALGPIAEQLMLR